MLCRVQSYLLYLDGLVEIGRTEKQCVSHTHGLCMFRMDGCVGI